MVDLEPPIPDPMEQREPAKQKKILYGFLFVLIGGAVLLGILLAGGNSSNDTAISSPPVPNETEVEPTAIPGEDNSQTEEPISTPSNTIQERFETGTVEIIGVKSLRSISYNIMGDRIECGTFCVAAALTEGNLKIRGFNPKLINTELNILKQTGAKIQLKKDEINIKGNNIIKNINHIKTKEYPAFPTDLQAAFMVLLCKARGRSIISENIFENRFMHVAELRRLGAKINTKKNKAYIDGNTKFEGAELMSSDLRASVALVLASIAAKGKSIIKSQIYHKNPNFS